MLPIKSKRFTTHSTLPSSCLLSRTLALAEHVPATPDIGRPHSLGTAWAQPGLPTWKLYPRLLQAWLLLIFQVPAQTSPPQSGCFWPLNL